MCPTVGHQFVLGLDQGVFLLRKSLPRVQGLGPGLLRVHDHLHHVVTQGRGLGLLIETMMKTRRSSDWMIHENVYHAETVDANEAFFEK